METRDLERFLSKVAFEDPEAGCWIWMAACNKKGYGLFKYKGKAWLASRLAYEFLVAPIPEGLTVDHLCRERSCVNPDHLRLLTGPENAADGNRLRTEFCRSGLHKMEGWNELWHNGFRQCRLCMNARQRERYHRAL